MKQFNIILATDLVGSIGLNNNLPWKFKLDTNYYNYTTSSHTILPSVNTSNNILIMGHNTWKSMKKRVLSNKLCFVITTQNNTNDTPNLFFYPDFHTAYLNAIPYTDSDIWVIGGYKIYDAALKHFACNQIYWTEIHGHFKSDVKINMGDYPIKWNHSITKTDTNLIDMQNYEMTFHQGTIIQNVETQYLETLYDLQTTGEKRSTRNGITYSKFNKTLSWDLENGFPLLTTKKMFWTGIVEELLFFIRGETNSNKLTEKGVKIWNPNTTRQFLDNLGLNYPVGEMGPMYGYQWRFFNKPYPNNDSQENQGIDQLKKVIEEIKRDPRSRRHLMTDFNPSQAHQGVLYPCHSIVIQFYVENNKLSCTMYQRSADTFLGLPFNIASTSLLVHIISQLTNLKPRKVNLVLGDYHIYEQHLDAVNEQIKRTSYQLPRLVMPEFETLEQVESSSVADYLIENYVSHPIIKAHMIA